MMLIIIGIILICKGHCILGGLILLEGIAYLTDLEV